MASLGLQGLDVLALPLSAIATLAPWKAGLATSLGPSLLIAMAAMALVWFAARSATMTIARVLTALAMAGAGPDTGRERSRRNRRLRNG